MLNEKQTYGMIFIYNFMFGIKIRGRTVVQYRNANTWRKVMFDHL